ncbi:hypothetical protein ACI3QN_13050, partial [Propionibacterium freudenreichii]|uniref:hypothetical protein n=1 Tax=Propionibacterium freudenreichii TaxID=1744 RepID=UPI0038535BA5
VQKWNEEQNNRRSKIEYCVNFLDELKSKGYVGNEVSAWIESLPKATPHSFVKPVEPTYIQELPDNAPLLAVEEKITKAIEKNKNA